MNNAQERLQLRIRRAFEKPTGGNSLFASMARRIERVMSTQTAVPDYRDDGIEVEAGGGHVGAGKYLVIHEIGANWFKYPHGLHELFVLDERGAVCKLVITSDWSDIAYNTVRVVELLDVDLFDDAVAEVVDRYFRDMVVAAMVRKAKELATVANIVNV